MHCFMQYCFESEENAIRYELHKYIVVTFPIEGIFCLFYSLLHIVMGFFFNVVFGLAKHISDYHTKSSQFITYPHNCV